MLAQHTTGRADHTTHCTCVCLVHSFLFCGTKCGESCLCVFMSYSCVDSIMLCCTLCIIQCLLGAVGWIQAQCYVIPCVYHDTAKMKHFICLITPTDCGCLCWEAGSFWAGYKCSPHLNSSLCTSNQTFNSSAKGLVAESVCCHHFPKEHNVLLVLSSGCITPYSPFLI